MRSIALALCLMLPTAALADEPAPPPAADQPANAALTPQDTAAEPQPAVENARWCGAHGGCSGAHRKGGLILLTGIAGTVLTGVAVGVAVGVATHKSGGPVTP